MLTPWKSAFESGDMIDLQRKYRFLIQVILAMRPILTSKYGTKKKSQEAEYNNRIVNLQGFQN